MFRAKEVPGGKEVARGAFSGGEGEGLAGGLPWGRAGPCGPGGGRCLVGLGE